MSDCLFCKIVKGEIPSKLVYQDSLVYAFYDVAPQAPVHFLVVPKKHISNLMELEAEDETLIGHLVNVAQKEARKLGFSETGARFVFNCKEAAGQTVPHVHLHVLCGDSFGWPPYPPKETHKC